MDDDDMVNDTTTLDGALAELGETMAANLNAQGVTASPEEGLTTLANKILDIEGGGGSGVPCYNVTFTGNSWDYTDYDFTNNTHYVHLEVYLEYQYEPYQGTVTLSDGTNTYTVNTNSSGLGTININISSATTTFTATYTNTSDNITVKRTDFVVLDKCNSSSNLSNYATSVPTYKSSSGNPSSTLSYDSSKTAYKLVATNTSTSYYSMIPMIDSYDIEDFVAEVLVYQNVRASNMEAGLFVKDRVSTSTSTYGVGASINVYADRFYMRRQSSSSTSTSVTITPEVSLSNQTWYRLKMTVKGSVISVEWYNTSGTLIGQGQYTQAISDKMLGFWLRGGSSTNSVFYFKELKVREI